MMKKIETALRSPLMGYTLAQWMGTAVMIGYLLTGIILAFANPDNILNYRWAQAFVEFMGGIVPSVAGLMPTSPIHDVAQFSAAVMWALAPFVTGALFFAMKDTANPFQERKIFGLFTFLVFTPLAIYFMYIDADGSSRIDRLGLSSRLGFAFIYNLALNAVPLFCAGMLTWIMEIPEVYFRRKKA